MGFFFFGLGVSAGYPNVTRATIFQSSGIFGSSLIFCSLKLPISHDPMPRVQAASAIFSKAIVVSTVAHFPVNNALGLAQPTIITGAFLRKRLNVPDSFCLISESFTMMKWHGCLFAAEGDCLPQLSCLKRHVVSPCSRSV